MLSLNLINKCVNPQIKALKSNKYNHDHNTLYIIY